MAEVSIAGLDKVALVQALYAQAQPLGMGRLQYTPGPLAEAEAAQLAEAPYIDYCHGRVMKVSLQDDTLHTDLYNRDNGEGRAEAIVAQVRAQQPVRELPDVIPSCAFCDQPALMACVLCGRQICMTHGMEQAPKIIGGMQVFSLDLVCRDGCAVAQSA